MTSSSPLHAICQVDCNACKRPQQSTLNESQSFSLQVGPVMSTFDLTPPTEAQRREITAGLDGSERRVLLEHGTEAALCGVFLENKRDGIYTCRFCGLPLFRSSATFDSGTGWRGFFRPYAHTPINRRSDMSYRTDEGD